MASWSPEIVVPGHGPVSDSQALIADRDYLMDMMKRVKAGIEAGKTPDELVAQINLSGHGIIASDAAANANSVRAMCKYFSRKQQVSQ